MKPTFDLSKKRRKKDPNVSLYLLKTPKGFPAVKDAFKSNCLLASFAIGTLYHEAQTESDPKMRQFKERRVTYINSTSKSRNNMDDKISRNKLNKYTIFPLHPPY